MKILVLAWNFPPAIGGIEVVADRLVAGLRGLGHEMHVVARHAPDAAGDDPAQRPATPGLLRFQCFSLARGFAVMRHTQRPDLILCPGIITAPVAWCLSLLFRRPYALLAHGSDVVYGGWAYQHCMRFLFNRARRVFANSRNTLNLLQAAGCDTAHAEIIHPGVDDADWPVREAANVSCIRERMGWGMRPIVLSSGRLVRRKGVLECVQHVLPILKQAYPDILYVFAGDEPTASLVHHERLRDVIQAQVEALGLKDNVLLTGRIDDGQLRDVYYAADVFLLGAIDTPGDVEGFGIVFLEAALAGLPAVSTRSGGIPEAVADGVSGQLHAPGDWDGMASSVAAWLGDPDQRNAVGAAARTRVLEEFTWTVIVRQYEQGLQTLCGDGA